MKFLITVLLSFLAIPIFAQGEPIHISTSQVEISEYDAFNYRKYDKKAGRRIGAHQQKVQVAERVDFALDYSYTNTFITVISEDAPSQIIFLKGVISDRVNYTKWYAFNNKLNRPWSKYYVYLSEIKNEIIFDTPNGTYRFFGKDKTTVCKTKLTSELLSVTAQLGIKAVDRKAIKAHYKAHLRENSETCEAIFYATKHNLKIPTNLKKAQIILQEKREREKAFEKTNDPSDLYVLINKKLLK